MKLNLTNKCLEPECEVTNITLNNAETLALKYCISIEKYREILGEGLIKSMNVENGLMSELNFRKSIMIALVQAYTDIEFIEEEMTDLSEQTYNIIISNHIWEKLMDEENSALACDFYDMIAEFEYMRKYQLSARSFLNEFQTVGDELKEKLKSYIENAENPDEIINKMEEIFKQFD